MIGIRVNNKLSVGQVPLKDKRVDRVNDNVVAPVDDQNRLFDILKVGVRLASWRSPLLQSRYLSQTARPSPLIEGSRLPPCALLIFVKMPARLPDLFLLERRIPPATTYQVCIRLSEDRFGFRGQRRHAIAAARSCSDEDKTSNLLGTVQSQLLGNESSERKAQEIDLLEP